MSRYRHSSCFWNERGRMYIPNCWNVKCGCTPLPCMLDHQTAPLWKPQITHFDMHHYTRPSSEIHQLLWDRSPNISSTKFFYRLLQAHGGKTAYCIHSPSPIHMPFRFRFQLVHFALMQYRSSRESTFFFILPSSCKSASFNFVAFHAC